MNPIAYSDLYRQIEDAYNNDADNFNYLMDLAVGQCDDAQWKEIQKLTGQSTDDIKLTSFKNRINELYRSYQTDEAERLITRLIDEAGELLNAGDLGRLEAFYSETMSKRSRSNNKRSREYHRGMTQILQAFEEKKSRSVIMQIMDMRVVTLTSVREKQDFYKEVENLINGAKFEQEGKITLTRQPEGHWEVTEGSWPTSEIADLHRQLKMADNRAAGFKEELEVMKRQVAEANRELEEVRKVANTERLGPQVFGILHTGVNQHIKYTISQYQAELYDTQERFEEWKKTHNPKTEDQGFEDMISITKENLREYRANSETARKFLDRHFQQ